MDSYVEPVMSVRKTLTNPNSPDPHGQQKLSNTSGEPSSAIGMSVTRRFMVRPSRKRISPKEHASIPSFPTYTTNSMNSGPTVSCSKNPSKPIFSNPSAFSVLATWLSVPTLAFVDAQVVPDSNLETEHSDATPDHLSDNNDIPFGPFTPDPDK
jgi:hypothetical protein